MGESSGQRTPVVESIRETAEDLRGHRKRPCLLYISRQVAHSDVLAVRAALEDEQPAALDVIVSSPGGDVEAAYLVARELRRRVQTLTVYIPFRTKSAATLIALAADELVLGSLGELGPLGCPVRGEASARLSAQHLPAPSGHGPPGARGARRRLLRHGDQPDPDPEQDAAVRSLHEGRRIRRDPLRAAPQLRWTRPAWRNPPGASPSVGPTRAGSSGGTGRPSRKKIAGFSSSAWSRRIPPTVSLWIGRRRRNSASRSGRRMDRRRRSSTASACS